MDTQEKTCVDCAAPGCEDGSGRYPSFCITKSLTEEDIGEATHEYMQDVAHAVMQAATQTTSHALSAALCRLEEIIEFARRMSYKKIGIAFCTALAEEARTTTRILRLHGFEVEGVACKVGGIRKTDLKVAESCCADTAISCNPLIQSEFLNERQTDLNIVIGLCVGHDILFAQNSQAPCTTFVVKDYMLGNNPAAVLSAVNTVSPYSRLLDPDARIYRFEEES